MSNKKYTLIFFVTGDGVAAGVLVCLKQIPAAATITNIEMPTAPPLWFKGDLTLNETAYRISGDVVSKTNGKAERLTVTTTVPNGSFKMNNKQFDRIIFGA